MNRTRRHFLQSSGGLLLSGISAADAAAADAAAADAAAADADPDLKGEVGITCATLGAHMTPRKRTNAFSLAELPRVAREELGMRVLDLATTNIGITEPAYLEGVRAEAEKAGCVFTNLKMNQPGIELGSMDPDKRSEGLRQYCQSVDAAALLGMKWVRPLPTKNAPESRERFLESMRELADYAAGKGLTMLIENYGWMQSDPNSVVDLISDLKRDLPSSPDTGNWDSNEIRYEGLEKTFPLAATCDFKVKTLGPGKEHAAYDLERCFRIGRAAGFNGPWCIEHGHRDRDILFQELRWIRDQLHGWMKAGNA